MRSQLSVLCVQAVPVSGCGVGDYSSVMRWMVVVIVCVGRDVIVSVSHITYTVLDGTLNTAQSNVIV